MRKQFDFCITPTRHSVTSRRSYHHIKGVALVKIMRIYVLLEILNKVQSVS